MKGFNKVIVAGNITKSPEVHFTQGGKKYARITVAANRQWRNKDGERKDEVDFIPVMVWGTHAENCEKYLGMGSAILVEGRLSVQKYEKDGEPHWKTEVIARSVQFLGGGKNRDKDGDIPF